MFSILTVIEDRMSALILPLITELHYSRIHFGVERDYFAPIKADLINLEFKTL